MQSYLRPDLLQAAGVADLGDWARRSPTPSPPSKSTPPERDCGLSPGLASSAICLSCWPFRQCSPTSSPVTKYRSRCRSWPLGNAKLSASNPTWRSSTSSRTWAGAWTISIRENRPKTTSSRSPTTGATYRCIRGWRIWAPPPIAARRRWPSRSWAYTVRTPITLDTWLPK